LTLFVLLIEGILASAMFLD